MSKAIDLYGPLDFDRHFELKEDFEHYVDADKWTVTATDAGAATIADGVNGVIALTASDGSVVDNDETYLEQKLETWLFAQNKAFSFKARVQFTEANTDDANVFVGMANAVAANLLVDDGAGLRTSGSYVGFLKVDGGTVWRLVSRNTDVNNDATLVTAGGASYQDLEFDVEDEGDGSSYVKVTFKINGQQIFNSATGRPFVQRVPIASATEMQVGFGVKNGGANLETLNIDRVQARKVR